MAVSIFSLCPQVVIQVDHDTKVDRVVLVPTATETDTRTHTHTHTHARGNQTNIKTNRLSVLSRRAASTPNRCRATSGYFSITSASLSPGNRLICERPFEMMDADLGSPVMADISPK